MQARGDLYVRYVLDAFGFVGPGDPFEDATGGNGNHHDAGSCGFTVPLGDILADGVAED